MQLCQCLNCFFKSHNKKLNQYCLNYIFFLPEKKNVLKNGSGHGLGRGLTCKKHGLGHESTYFCFRSKKSSSSSVFFGPGKKILTRFAMSTISYHLTNSFAKALKSFFFFISYFYFHYNF